MTPRSLLFVVLALTACGSTGSLSGSLTDSDDFSYARSTLEATGNTLVLRFLQTRGTAEDTALKVSVTLDAAGAPTHALQLDLTQTVNGGAQRGAATRNVLDDPNTSLPALLRGDFTLDGDMSMETTATGSFSMTFVQGNVFGSGMAIFGQFSAEVMK